MGREEKGRKVRRGVRQEWVGGRKTDGKEIKVSTETETINKEQYQEDIGRMLLLLECSNTPQGPQHMISLDFFHNKWKSDTCLIFFEKKLIKIPTSAALTNSNV